MLVSVILSGGAGTRLWPVSRSAYPKPFMRMGDGETLLRKTLDRALRCADGAPVLTVTGRDYYFLTRDEYAQRPGAALDRLPFLLEPAGRNTAPAVVLDSAHLLLDRQQMPCHPVTEQIRSIGYYDRRGTVIY